MLSVAAVTVFAVTGCQWCCEVIPNDPGCIKTSHDVVTKNTPATTTMVTPHIAISREVFRPVFRAGTERITVQGSGNDREDATYDAITKFLAKTNCDYIVSVSTIAVKQIHPKPWWYLLVPRSSNYTVTLSGIPVYLDKLSTETLAADKVEAYDGRSGLYLPTRGYDAPTVRAWRENAPMPPLAPVPYKVDKLPPQIGSGVSAVDVGKEVGASLLPFGK